MGDDLMGTAARRAAILCEALGATALALFLALRFDAPAAWIAVPLVAIAVRRRSLGDYGLELRLSPPSLRTQLAVGAALLAVYAVAHGLVAEWFFHQRFVPRWPRSPFRLLGAELVSVAIPEEFFFRGWLQKELDRAFPWRGSAFGARLGVGFWLQAAIFALCHLHSGDWTQLRVFVFALLAGWLRERSGSILAPSIWHATANVAYRAIAGCFR